MKRIFFLFLLGAAPVWAAQTNLLTGNVGDYGLAAQARKTVTTTLLSPNPRTDGTVLVRQDPVATRTDTNGNFYFTNFLWGYYALELEGLSGTRFKFTVWTNTSGTTPIASLITNTYAAPPDPSSNYYSMSQVDALVAALPTAAQVAAKASTNDTRAVNLTNAANVFAGDGSGLTGVPAGTATNVYHTAAGTNVSILTNSYLLTLSADVSAADVAAKASTNAIHLIASTGMTVETNAANTWTLSSTASGTAGAVTNNETRNITLTGGLGMSGTDLTNAGTVRAAQFTGPPTIAQVGESNLVVVIDGDSQTYPLSGDWPSQLAQLSFCSNRCVVFTNIAVSGTGLDGASGATNRYETIVHPLFLPTATQRGYYLLYIGVNDVSDTYENWINIYSNLCLRARSDGFRVICFTFPRDVDATWHSPYFGSTYDLAGETMNQWLRGSSTVWDRLVDLRSAFPNPYDQEFFNADHLHFNNAGKKIIAHMVNQALWSDSSPAVRGVPVWEAIMPLRYAPYVTTNWAWPRDFTTDWGSAGIYRYADVLRHDTNATGNLTSQLSWPIPYGFTNLAVVVTVSALYPPLTYKADVAIDAADVGVRSISFVSPPVLYDTTNSTWTTTISCSPTNIGGIRNFTLYFMNSNWTLAPTNKFYLKQVRLIGY